MNHFNIQQSITMTSHRHSLWTALALALAFGAVACGDDNAGPSDDDGNVINVPDGGNETGGAGGSSGSSGEGGSSGSSGEGGTGGDDEDGGAGSGGDGGTGGTIIDAGQLDSSLPDCTDTANDTEGTPSRDCWALNECDPTDSEHFLGACSGTCFAPFNNTTRIEGYTGTLPPLN